MPIEDESIRLTWKVDTSDVRKGADDAKSFQGEVERVNQSLANLAVSENQAADEARALSQAVREAKEASDDASSSSGNLRDALARKGETLEEVRSGVETYIQKLQVASQHVYGFVESIEDASERVTDFNSAITTSGQYLTEIAVQGAPQASEALSKFGMESAAAAVSVVGKFAAVAAAIIAVEETIRRAVIPAFNEWYDSLARIEKLGVVDTQEKLNKLLSEQSTIVNGFAEKTAMTKIEQLEYNKALEQQRETQEKINNLKLEEEKLNRFKQIEAMLSTEQERKQAAAGQTAAQQKEFGDKFRSAMQSIGSGADFINMLTIAIQRREEGFGRQVPSDEAARREALELTSKSLDGVRTAVDEVREALFVFGGNRGEAAGRAIFEKSFTGEQVAAVLKEEMAGFQEAWDAAVAEEAASKEAAVPAAVGPRIPQPSGEFLSDQEIFNEVFGAPNEDENVVQVTEEMLNRVREANAQRELLRRQMTAMMWGMFDAVNGDAAMIDNQMQDVRELQAAIQQRGRTRQRRGR